MSGPTLAARILAEPPQNGDSVELRPGVWWLRLPLPFRLDHVNLYLLEDNGGYVVVDTGLSDDGSRAIWEMLFAGQLSGRRLNGVIATHHHPDHIGLAGWLCRRNDAQLITSEGAYFNALALLLDPGLFDRGAYRRFHVENGMAPRCADHLCKLGVRFGEMVDPLPETFRRVVDGDVLTIGGRTFQVLTGNGHASELIMLYCAQDRLLLAGDQVLERITPNIQVSPMEPEGDPLGYFLLSLQRIVNEVGSDVLVLPGHGAPFSRLHERCREIIDHHDERCEKLVHACTEKPSCVADLVPVLFSRPLDDEHFGHAFGETLAHLNRLVRQGRLRKDRQGVNGRVVFVP